ncbi:MAG: hypothetical protein ACRD1N_06740 [Terriglobia bacterium]
MADPKKRYNPANAMFGLGDEPEQPSTGRPSEPAKPAAPRTPSGESYPPPGVSFGQTQPSEAREPAGSATPRAAGSDDTASRAPGAAPQYVYVQSPPAANPPAHGSGLKWLVVILLIIACADLALILWGRQQSSQSFAKQADQLNLLTRRADSMDQRYADLSARFQVTAERLGMTQQELTRARQLAANIEKQQKQNVQQLNAAIAEKASAQQVNQLQSQATTKFGQLSGSIAGTQKDLDATKEALTGAKGELSGAIARTHSELVALAHRTDRDYFEFHLPRKNARQKIGSLQVQLLKTDTKHNLFTVNLFFDDKVSQRRNEAIDEPVFFYMQGAPNALELVVNKVGKNTIAGYVSAPKGFIPNATNVLTARPNT